MKYSSVIESVPEGMVSLSSLKYSERSKVTTKKPSIITVNLPVINFQVDVVSRKALL